MSKLALFGGNPVNTEPMKFVWPLITDETIQAVTNQMTTAISIYNRSGVYEQFEDAYKNYHGLAYALTTNSGTTALWSMLYGAGITSGDEVIVPAYTFFATASPLLSLGATPVLCDCDETGNLDPRALAALLTTRTKAVVVTHMWGIPADMPSIKAFCDEHKLMLFEDCSHAHGARIQGKLVGTWGTAAAWSLQGQKIVTGGELGILATNDPEIYVRAQLLGHFNKRSMQEIPQDHALYEYAVTGAGLKLRANVLGVAMANEQFTRLDQWLKQKREFAALFDSHIRQIPGLSIPSRYPDSEPAWYAYVLQYDQDYFEGVPRSLFQKAVFAEGAIELDIPSSTCPLARLELFQQPEQLHTAYTDYVSPRVQDFPQAESFYTKALKLPVWVRVADEATVRLYINAIEKVATNWRELLSLV